MFNHGVIMIQLKPLVVFGRRSFVLLRLLKFHRLTPHRHRTACALLVVQRAIFVKSLLQRR